MLAISLSDQSKGENEGKGGDDSNTPGLSDKSRSRKASKGDNASEGDIEGKGAPPPPMQRTRNRAIRVANLLDCKVDQDWFPGNQNGGHSKNARTAISVTDEGHDRLSYRIGDGIYEARNISKIAKARQNVDVEVQQQLVDLRMKGMTFKAIGQELRFLHKTRFCTMGMSTLGQRMTRWSRKTTKLMRMSRKTILARSWRLTRVIDGGSRVGSLGDVLQRVRVCVKVAGLHCLYATMDRGSIHTQRRTASQMSNDLNRDA